MNKIALDEVSNKYWKEYLKETGLDKQFIKEALNKIDDIIDLEESGSPESIRNAMRELEYVYNSFGKDFVRVLRQNRIQAKLADYGVSSILFRNVPDEFVDKLKSLTGFCMHKVGSNSVVLHFESSDKMDEFVNKIDIRSFNCLPVRG